MTALHVSEDPELERPRTVVTDDLGDMTCIFDPAVNVCVVRRPRGWDDASHVVGGRAYLQRDEIPPWSPPSIRDDVGFLSTLLMDLLGAHEVGARLASASRPMCPRLHVDHVPVRLVCTYRGRGTQWVDEAQGEAWFDCKTTRRRGTLRTAQAGDIVLLKGEAWPRNEGRGAAHRSPAHEEERIVVSLDPM